MQADTADQPVVDLEEGAHAHFVTLPAGLRQPVIGGQVFADHAVLAGRMASLGFGQDDQRLEGLAIACLLYTS